MRYHIWAFSIHYASFNQDEDAQRWALDQSRKFARGWWEVRDTQGYPVIAFENGEIVYGRDNNILGELML